MFIFIFFVSFSLSGLSFDVWVNRIDNKLAMIRVIILIIVVVIIIIIIIIIIITMLHNIIFCITKKKLRAQSQ